MKLIKERGEDTMRKISSIFLVIILVISISVFNSGCSLSDSDLYDVFYDDSNRNSNVVEVFTNACRLSFVNGLDEAIEIKFSFTNNSGSDMCFNDYIIDKAYQNGEQLEPAYTSFFIDNYSDTKQDTKIRNGATIEVITIYQLVNNTSFVELELTTFSGAVLYSKSISVPEAPVEGMLFNNRWTSLPIDEQY